MKTIGYLILLITANVLAWRLGTARGYKEETANEKLISLISFAVGVLSGTLLML